MAGSIWTQSKNLDVCVISMILNSLHFFFLGSVLFQPGECKPEAAQVILTSWLCWLCVTWTLFWKLYSKINPAAPSRTSQRVSLICWREFGLGRLLPGLWAPAQPLTLWAFDPSGPPLSWMFLEPAVTWLQTGAVEEEVLCGPRSSLKLLMSSGQRCRTQPGMSCSCTQIMTFMEEPSEEKVSSSSPPTTAAEV